MNILFSRQAKMVLYTITIVSFCVLLVIIGWKTLFFGNIKIVIEGNHNPITDLVFLDNDRLFPAGEGGREYHTRTRVGTARLKIVGPFIEEKSVETEVERMSEKKIAIKPKPVTKDELVLKYVPGDFEGTIEESILFGNRNNWLVANTYQEDWFKEYEFFVFYYDVNILDWKLIASGKKIDTGAFVGLGLPEKLLDYLEEKAGD